MMIYVYICNAQSECGVMTLVWIERTKKTMVNKSTAAHSTAKRNSHPKHHRSKLARHSGCKFAYTPWMVCSTRKGYLASDVPALVIVSRGLVEV